MNAAVEVGNTVVNARRMATDPGQAEASRHFFNEMVGKEEIKFRPLYQAFEQAKEQAAQAGVALRQAFEEAPAAEVGGSLDSELRTFLDIVDPALLNTVSAAVIAMRAPFRPPAGPFMEALQQANADVANEPYFGQPGFKGFIYTGPPAVPAQPGATSVADELTKLATLRDKGVLTDAEFAAQKAKLLGA